MKGNGGQNTLVIVDDEPYVLKALTRLLSKDGYHIRAFSQPMEAVEYLAQEPAGVIIADQCMPQMEGSDLLKVVNEHQPEIINIILSGLSDRAVEGLETMQLNSYSTISKPWDDESLRLTVAEGFDAYKQRVNRRR